MRSLLCTHTHAHTHSNSELNITPHHVYVCIMYTLQYNTNTRELRVYVCRIHLFELYAHLNFIARMCVFSPLLFADIDPIALASSSAREPQEFMRSAILPCARIVAQHSNSNSSRKPS